MLTAHDLIKQGVSVLKLNNILTPELDARLLLEFVVNLTREEIFLNNPQINQELIQKYLILVDRRAKNEPLAYIIGYKEFYGFNFIVNKNVLIPRPETEIIIDEAIKYFLPNDQISILDLGTGSGCIIITLLNLLPKAIGAGLDISSKALQVAAKNKELYKLESRLSLVEVNWEHYNYTTRFDLIVANPPYISNKEYQELALTVRDYEPKTALVAEQEGLECYYSIASLASNLLKDSGLIIVEFGHNQAATVQQIFDSKGFTISKILKDLSNIPRIGIFQK